MAKQKQKAAKPASGIALASEWPVYEVLLSRGWEQHGHLVTTLIARRSPRSGKVACGLLLVDLACLGVKSAQVQLAKDPAAYRDGIRKHALGIQPMAAADFDLVAKIVYTGIEYAANLGFKPDPIFAQAEALLSGADLDANTTPIPTGGEDGKPLYINGPNDNPQRIINTLLHTVGEGNFHYVIQGPAGDFALADDDFDDAIESQREV